MEKNWKACYFFGIINCHTVNDDAESNDLRKNIPVSFKIFFPAEYQALCSSGTGMTAGGNGKIT